MKTRNHRTNIAATQRLNAIKTQASHGHRITHIAHLKHATFCRARATTPSREPRRRAHPKHSHQARGTPFIGRSEVSRGATHCAQHFGRIDTNRARKSAHKNCIGKLAKHDTLLLNCTHRAAPRRLRRSSRECASTQHTRNCPR